MVKECTTCQRTNYHDTINHGRNHSLQIELLMSRDIRVGSNYAPPKYYNVFDSLNNQCSVINRRSLFLSIYLSIYLSKSAHIYLSIYLTLSISLYLYCPVSWGSRMHRPNECPGYDTKKSDGEVPAMLEL